METPKKNTRPRMVAALIETFGLNPTVAFVIVILCALIGLLAIYWIVQSAPPRTLVLSSGPPGSAFEHYAVKYEKILASNGVTLRVLPSKGSLENLQRLESSQSGVDIGFVQGGLAAEADLSALVSLGSIAYEPLWVFYRSPARINHLAELSGKRIAVGTLGSGTHALALTLLQTNGITSGSSTLLDLDSEAAAAGLMEGKLDAVFLMGDSASRQTLRALLRSPEINLYAFTQADAYSRRFAYLNKMELPEGSIDLEKDLPAQDIALVGPTVELVARAGLHPALSDLLLQVAQEVHGKAGLLQKRGEFPAPLEHDEFKISDDALRYYRSGKGLLYRTVHSFWLASLLNRILVVFVPTLLVLYPTIRFLPVAYRWRIQLRIYRCYRPLLHLEWEASGTLTSEQEQELVRRLDEIEKAVNGLRVPAYFADQFYGLQGHLAFVRARLKAAGRV
jgi:TRAP transporter TAXI family solute receptor